MYYLKHWYNFLKAFESINKHTTRLIRNELSRHAIQETHWTEMKIQFLFEDISLYYLRILESVNHSYASMAICRPLPSISPTISHYIYMSSVFVCKRYISRAKNFKEKLKISSVKNRIPSDWQRISGFGRLISTQNSNLL